MVHRNYTTITTQNTNIIEAQSSLLTQQATLATSVHESSGLIMHEARNIKEAVEFAVTTSRTQGDIVSHLLSRILEQLDDRSSSRAAASRATEMIGGTTPRNSNISHKTPIECQIELRIKTVIDGISDRKGLIDSEDAKEVMEALVWLLAAAQAESGPNSSKYGLSGFQRRLVSIQGLLASVDGFLLNEDSRCST